MTSRKAPNAKAGAKALAALSEGEMMFCPVALLILDGKADYSMDAIGELPYGSGKALAVFFNSLALKIEDLKEVISPLCVARSPLPLKSVA